eukprot:4476062-Pyramimonas_sp.AAC.1
MILVRTDSGIRATAAPSPARTSATARPAAIQPEPARRTTTSSASKCELANDTVTCSGRREVPRNNDPILAHNSECSPEDK